MTDRATCAACNRTIDAAARICPYCGADPTTAERVDTRAILQEVFQAKEVTTSESVIDFARQRQGIVITISLVVLFLVLGGLHQFVTARNASAVTDAPAVPLTELTDVTRREDVAPVPMPEIDYQYDGRPQAMRTFIAERGAVPPPEVVAAQQAPTAAAAPAGRGQAPAQPRRPVAPPNANQRQ